MNEQLLFPGLLLLIISISGLILNYWKNPTLEKVKRQADQHSLLYFRLFYPAGIVLAFLISSFYPQPLPLSWSILIPASLAFFISGMIIRWIAVLSLGDRFNVQLTILQQHKLKQNGIFRLVRHPSYSGLILYYIGLGIALNNYVSLICLLLPVIIVIIYRIEKEECLLAAHFHGEYANYQSKTKKLIPWLY